MGKRKVDSGRPKTSNEQKDEGLINLANIHIWHFKGPYTMALTLQPFHNGVNVTSMLKR
jgi:hypothetical protein